MRCQRAVCLTLWTLLVEASRLVKAHDDNSPDSGSSETIAHGQESYFRHAHYVGWHRAHIGLMLLAWIVAMPVAIMLSIARSRYHLPAHIFFHLLNGLGVVTGVLYNASTPNLYVGNAHHGLGWAVFVFTGIWTLVSLYTHVAFGQFNNKQKVPGEQDQPLMSQRMATSSQFRDETPPRQSIDATEELQDQGSPDELSAEDGNFDDREDQKATSEPEKPTFLANIKFGRLHSRRACKLISFCQLVLERVLLLLGFVALTSGFIVSGGLFRGSEVFNGIAHYIKGGIFFWYGILTMGRWMGAFAEFGWAWNIRPRRVPRWKTIVPSAEFTESFVIWAHGTSNVFLEHLNNSNGSEWALSDLEHLSITILFFGGGLLGMMIECKWVRNLGNISMDIQKIKEDDSFADASRFANRDDQWQNPSSSQSLNPMPALTIMLLGMMMSAHKQQSMVSTMLHAQWGGLLSAFALARGVTYTTLFLKPLTSFCPSRPPSEIVASFCLCAGGILFMNSASDIVWAIESNGLDAMVIFTVSMGLTGIILAWEIVIFSIKEWAVRRERDPIPGASL